MSSASISFFSWPASKTIFTLRSFTHCPRLFVLTDTCGFGSCLMISLCARVWVKKDILPMLMNSFQGKFRSVSQSFSCDHFKCANMCMLMCPYFLFRKKSAVMHSEYETPSSRFLNLCFTERKKERENPSNSFPSTLTSSWDPEERLRALRPHESCLSYCCGRWRDGLMRH